ncbi:segregation/condensation protein A [Haloimpatiens sp. FM7330]|uniref:segregation/condensation protein A n=1 Tax=Haloimpatiens sp. FM7330 TaxID=3298610 RepID=UPI0036334F14
MSLKIKIHNFEGPFDLLLHLIKKNKMDIYDIKIHEITNQYLEYINSMKEMDLEITSEFIVIAATLLEIKSRLLLPKRKEENDENDENMDPRKELMDKLIEYNKFKKVAAFLKERENTAGIVFSKKPEIIENKKIDKSLDFLKKVTMLDLFNIYNSVMNRYINKTNHNNSIKKEMIIDNFKVEDKMTYLKNKINEKSKFKFSEVIEECSVKIEVVVTFLALLELIKLKVINVYQDGNFTEIYLEGTVNSDGK